MRALIPILFHRKPPQETPQPLDVAQLFSHTKIKILRVPEGLNLGKEQELEDCLLSAVGIYSNRFEVFTSATDALKRLLGVHALLQERVEDYKTFKTPTPCGKLANFSLQNLHAIFSEHKPLHAKMIIATPSIYRKDEKEEDLSHFCFFSYKEKEEEVLELFAVIPSPTTQGHQHFRTMLVTSSLSYKVL